MVLGERWRPFDEHAVEYDRWFEKHPGLYREELALLSRMMPSWRRGVEVGVGTGRSAWPLGITRGLEPSLPMGRMARKRGIEVICGVAESLPFPDRSFDLVLMVTVNFLLRDVKAAFLEASRVLSAGGSLLLAFIEREGELGQKYRRKTDSWWAGVPTRFYTLPEVILLLEEAGFRDLRVGALENGFFVVLAGKE
ncbi:MAG: methyltransferase domain-containing protein [Methanomicrobiaceae archaeon]|nr:methyltransferase domain-containing protein [Methanomicrobiaceae archaeon]